MVGFVIFPHPRETTRKKTRGDNHADSNVKPSGYDFLSRRLHFSRNCVSAVLLQQPDTLISSRKFLIDKLIRCTDVTFPFYMREDYFGLGNRVNIEILIRVYKTECNLSTGYENIS